MKEYQGSGTPVWTSAEASIEPQNSVLVACFDTDVKKSYIDSSAKGGYEHSGVRVDYMISF